MSTMKEQIAYLATLKDGWLDGQGRAPTEEAIKTAYALAEVIRPGAMSIFPRLCGGIEFENPEIEAIEFEIEASGAIRAEIL